MQVNRRVEVPTAADVFLDPVVQLAALCPICALAALRPEAAIAALAPTLVLFNPALNPEAALLSFALGTVRPRPRWVHGTRHTGVRTDSAGAYGRAGAGTVERGGGAVYRTEGSVARAGRDRWVFSTLQRG